MGLDVDMHAVIPFELSSGICWNNYIFIKSRKMCQRVTHFFKTPLLVYFGLHYTEHKLQKQIIGFLSNYIKKCLIFKHLLSVLYVFNYLKCLAFIILPKMVNFCKQRQKTKMKE